MGFIYKITNILNGKCYIGETTEKNPLKRWQNHKCAIKAGRGCPVLRNAFIAHGEESFTFEIVRECSNEYIIAIEEYYIEQYDALVPNGYNVSPGGTRGGSFLGHKHSEEAKKKMLDASKKYFKDPANIEKHRLKAIEINKKVDHIAKLKNSEKWNKARQEGRIGGYSKNMTNETKQKIRDSVNKYYEIHNGTTLNKEKHSVIMINAIGRKIIQYTLTGEILNEFNSITEGAKQTGIGRRAIQANVSDRTKSSGGFIWKYKQ